MKLTNYENETIPNGPLVKHAVLEKISKIHGIVHAMTFPQQKYNTYKKFF